MPAFNRSSGSWRSVQTIYSRSETSWGRIAAGWVHDGTDWQQFFVSGIQDHFNRTAGALGRTSDDKQQWTQTRGSWSITSNQARSTSTASTYPIATVDVGNAYAVVEADTPTPGSGVAFGVVDANNWYGAYISRRGFSYDCNPYSCNPVCIASACGTCTKCTTTEVCTCNSCTVCLHYKKLESYKNENYECTPSGWVYKYGATYSCATCSCQSFSRGTCGPGGSGYGVISSQRICLGTWGCAETPSCGCINSTTDSCCSTTCSNQTVCTTYTNDCAQCGSVCTQYSYSTCYETCTDSYYSVRLIQCVNGVVSEIGMVEGVENDPALVSIRVETSDQGISATGYTSAGQAGDSLNVSSQVIPTGTRLGLLVGPSPLSQGSTLDNFYAEETE